MYHCHIQLYFTGPRTELLEAVRDVPVPEDYSYTYTRSAHLDRRLLSQADLILADLSHLGTDVLEILRLEKKRDAELILLADREQIDLFPDDMDGVRDIWTLPLSEKEMRFHFRRWQEGYKLGRDLWETEQYLNAAMNGSPNLVWFKTRDGVHEKVNDSFCRAVNKTRAQVRGQCHAYIWDVEEDDPACVGSELEVMRTQRPFVSDEAIQTGMGIRHLTTFKSPLYDLDGTVMGTVGLGIDMTRERAYEEEILSKNKTLELLFSNLDCGVMCHSLDGHTVLSVNPAALQLLDYASKEEMMDSGFDMVAMSVVEEDRKRLREAMLTLKRPGDSVSAEYRVRHRDGKELHVLGNLKLMEENGVRFYQRFLLDITARKLREEEKWAQKDQEVQYQEQMFEIFSTFLSKNVDDVYMMLDLAAQRVEFASSNIERVLGITQKEIEQGVGRLGHARYISGSPASMEELLQMEPGMSLDDLETERVNPQTGEHKWFHESVHCVSVQGTKKIISYISDRTKERKIQDTLTEALEIAQVASKAKSAFLSSVSHDIRTPMNAIMGFVELLREEADNADHVVEYTQKISAASQHLLSLINDVLDMNKIESGSTVLNISELNMAEIIDELNTIIRPQTRMKDQTFDIYATSLNYEHLLGDKLRINQILINILSNAVKYTQRGGRIEMRVAELPQLDEKYDRIQFIVSDNGQGMGEDYLKIIFDPFSREQTSTLNKIQGTGLGMAITKSLVDLMGGTIRVESALGEGSTFTVELELRIQDRENEDPKFWEKHGVTRMIVADDDEDICLDIVKKMGAIGVETHYATHGAQAIQDIRAARERGRPYDLILLDWKMPGLDGMETARLIRKNYPEKIPILLFTAYDWGEIEQEALEVGIEHFLPKPFFMTNFKEAVQRMMGGRKPPAPAEKVSAFKGRHILVVDDIDVNRLLLTKILSTLGAQCETASDGQEAVDKFLASQPGEYDIIFMDVQMPVLNGYEATRAIRASGHPYAAQVPIIAMTANAFVDDIRNSMEAGMDAHVAKPIVLDQLETTIREVLERKGLLSR